MSCTSLQILSSQHHCRFYQSLPSRKIFRPRDKILEVEPFKTLKYILLYAVHDRKITPFGDERKRWQIPGLQPLSVPFKTSWLIYKSVLSTNLKPRPTPSASITLWKKRVKEERAMVFFSTWWSTRWTRNSMWNFCASRVCNFRRIWRILCENCLRIKLSKNEKAFNVKLS